MRKVTRSSNPSIELYSEECKAGIRYREPEIQICYLPSAFDRMFLSNQRNKTRFIQALRECMEEVWVQVKKFAAEPDTLICSITVIGGGVE